MSTAPAERIFDLLADVTTWRSWTDFDDAVLASPGTSEPNGVGAIRQFRRGRVRSREEVVAFERPNHLGYRLVSGIPVRDYRADVTLAPAGNGTSITWHSEFRAKWPGTGALVRRELTKFIEQTAKGLARVAESAASAA